MLRLIRLTSVLGFLLAAVPAYAQVYKWLDEHGVTNYSSKPPADRGAGLKLATVADRISIYAPEPAVRRMINATSPARNRILSDRVDSLERQLAAERQSSQSAAAAEASAAQAAYAQCVAERRVDCDYDSGYYPYGSGGALSVIGHRPRPANPIAARPRRAAEDIARLHSGGKLSRVGDLRP